MGQGMNNDKMLNGSFRLKRSPWYPMQVKDWPSTPATLTFLTNRISWIASNPDDSNMPDLMVEGLLRKAESIKRNLTHRQTPQCGQS